MDMLFIGSCQSSCKDHIVILFALRTGLCRVTGQTVLSVIDVGCARIALAHRFQSTLRVIQHRHRAHAGAEKPGQRTVIGSHLQDLCLRFKVIPLKQQLTLGRECIQQIQPVVVLQDGPDISAML